MEERIANLVDMKSYREQIVFVSYYYNQLSIEEISAETGMPIGTVHSCLTGVSKRVAETIGHTGMYYVALMIFFALGNEATFNSF